MHLVFVVAATALLAAQTTADSTWRFAVSGDSRNCGNVVMPSIAAGAKKNGAVFYWHLGDLRATAEPDEDYKAEPEHRRDIVINKNEYLADEWNDFIRSQITPFDPLPLFLGIGNHEVVSPKTKPEFVAQFKQWLSAPALEKQRAADAWDKGPRPRTYYHWIQGGIDFIYLDNSTPDEFDPQQVKWFENVLRHASGNTAVQAVIVGMHKALPESLSASHSMNETPVGISTGHRVYADLLKFKRNTRKPVYVLASHSHFFMSDIFETDYWKMHGGVLPGWIVGTAGAFRYVLPPAADRAKEKKTKVYGFLLGTVHPGGKVDFTFQEIQRGDVLDAVTQRYGPQFVDYCFDQNADPAIGGATTARPPAAK
jgi:hypothetical protein